MRKFISVASEQSSKSTRSVICELCDVKMILQKALNDVNDIVRGMGVHEKNTACNIE